MVSRDGKTEYTGPPMIGKRSQIGAMIDPSGRVVSQQVIIIESLLKGVEDNTTSYKELHRDMVEIAKRQAIVVDAMNKRGLVDDDDAQAKLEFLRVFEEFCKKTMTKMETAYTTFAALPHVIEGDRGIYEHSRRPVPTTPCRAAWPYS